MASDDGGLPCVIACTCWCCISVTFRVKV